MKFMWVAYPAKQRIKSPSLPPNHHLLVNSKHQWVETFRRGEQGLWILQTYQEESFSLQSINLTASFRDLYEDVTLETVNDTPEST